MWRKRTGRSPSATGCRFRPSLNHLSSLCVAFAAVLIASALTVRAAPPDPAGRDVIAARLASVRAAPYVAKRSEPGAADSLAAALAAPTDLDSLVRTVEDLVAFGTRYEYTPEQESAAVYLFGRLEAMGYEPFYAEYGLSEWDLRRTDFVGSGERGWAAASHDQLGAVLRTDDDGAMWTTEFRADAGLFDIAVAGSDVRWAVGDSGFVFRSASGVWAIHDTLGTRRLSAVAFLDSLRGLVASQSGSVYRTNDGGATWTEEAITTSPIYDVEFVSGSMAWAAGSSQGIWLWTPATGWVNRNSGLGTISDIAFAGPERGIAIVSSRNRALLWDGSTWKQVTTPIPRGYTVAVAPDSSFWIAGLDDPVLLTLVYREVDPSADSMAWEQVLFPSFPFLARNINTIQLSPAGEVIAGGVDGLFVRSEDRGETWTSVPLPDDLVHRSRNVGAEIPGRTSPDSVVILSAHYDSYAQPPYYDPYASAPGADDDASGVAAVLEAARLLAGKPSSKTIRFLLFSGEELGLLGSTAYATARVLDGEAIAADVQIDMIGRSDGPLLLYANVPSAPLLGFAQPVRSLATPDLPCSLLVAPEMVYSDHASFWANGYPAVLIAEEFEVSTHDLHTSNDTLGNFDMPFFERSARFATAYVARLAGGIAPAPPADSVDALPPYPNPAAGPVTFRFEAPASGPVSLQVYDVAGRRVRSIPDAAYESVEGIASLEWDGHTGDDRRAAPGVYFLRVQTPDRTITKKTVMLR